MRMTHPAHRRNIDAAWMEDQFSGLRGIAWVYRNLRDNERGYVKARDKLVAEVGRLVREGHSAERVAVVLLHLLK